ncbi:MAG TPA: folylpolyglutamate synthase/dihydrofolate synthase family protein [Chthoniobacterales bacterium]|nr:folylpolyglutamate synthase/dihydrofolate synthase family protein [Chthoniobacterales bacterium]
MQLNAAYDIAVEWLFATQQRGMKFGLENMRRLLVALDEPQKSLKVIHVAGTNGKGSVCAMLDSLARSAGIKSGLFTSPHLVRFNERIQVDRKPIGDDSVVSGLHRIREQLHDDYYPTFFEITTALALDYFRAVNVDLAILETGLGGRLDATNIVTPLASVLTSIDLDHQKWLGNTIDEIALEKAGIIKPAVPVVSVPQIAQVRRVIEQVALERSAPLYYVNRPLSDMFVGLPGSHQRINAAVACETLVHAGFHLTEQERREGLANVFWPGRFQRLGARIVLDGAHNPAASQRLIETWKECVGKERPTIIFGGLGEKDLLQMLSVLSKIAARFYIVPVRSRRAAATDEIQALVPANVPSSTFNSVTDALELAQESDELILVTGSLFLVGEVLALLQPAQGSFQASNQ